MFIFCADQIFVYFVVLLSMIIYEVLYTWCLRYSICSAWFLDIRLLKGQCVGMEAVQFWWFHWQWNHHETKGLCSFTVHMVNSRRHTRSTCWKTTKVYRRMEQWKQMYLCFNETFVKWRKLRVDPSESVWYAVKGQSETLARVSTMGLQWGCTHK